MPFRSLRVPTRFMGGLGATIALGLLIALFGAMQMQALATDLNEVANNRVRKVDQLSAVKSNLDAAAMDPLNIPLKPGTGWRASQTKRIAELRADNVHQGREVVAQVVATIKGIKKPSRKISDIIGVIGGIATCRRGSRQHRRAGRSRPPKRSKASSAHAKPRPKTCWAAYIHVQNT